MITEVSGDVVNRVLPNTAITMAFRLRGQVNDLSGGVKNKMPLSLISGLRKSNRLINYSRNAGNLIVLFKEESAAAMIKEPLYELAGQSLSLNDLHGYQDMSDLEDQLAETTNDKQRINLVEQFLFSKLRDYKPDPLVNHSLELIKNQKGIVRIKELADTLCISQDAFEKRFRKVVGSSPKHFAYLIRMKSVLDNGLTIQSLTETAFNAGYFDQSHFIKDFKLFTGLTPSEFIRLSDQK